MSDDVHTRIDGRAGRITLNRPDALNAMTYAMCRDIDAALRDWRSNDTVACVLMDATGDKAFCAGGDIAELYRTGTAGDYDYGRRFWRDEYRMNAMIAAYPKPVQSFLQGFTMGGGVGLGCHASLRIVGENSRIAMPECGIGLVPDVGGSHILSRLDQIFPGAGAWIGLTGLRLDHQSATLAGFADRFQTEAEWPKLKQLGIETGQPNAQVYFAPPPENPALTPGLLQGFAKHFSLPGLPEIIASLAADDSDEARTALASMGRASPLSLACHLEMLRRLGPDSTLREALQLEYRFVWRAMEHGDLLEGIRAQIIDKDRKPRWQHESVDAVTREDVDRMLAPLGDNELTFED